MNGILLSAGNPVDLSSLAIVVVVQQPQNFPVPFAHYLERELIARRAKVVVNNGDSSGLNIPVVMNYSLVGVLLIEREGEAVIRNVFTFSFRFLGIDGSVLMSGVVERIHKSSESRDRILTFLASEAVGHLEKIDVWSNVVIAV